MKHRVPDLHTLSSKKIGEVIGDLRLQLQGTRIYYAIDPYEIFDFCFPVNPIDFRSKDINTIADDQAALFDVIYARPEKPILLPDYILEIGRILNYFNHSVNKAYSKTTVLAELLAKLGLEETLPLEKEQALESLLNLAKESGLDEISSLDAIPEGKRKEAEKYLNVVQEDFNIILAVAMGVYSLGVERFNDIYERYLTLGRIETGHAQDDATIAGIMSKYTKGNLADFIYERLVESFADKSDLEQQRRRRSARNDATAIDRLIWLNRNLEEAYSNGELRHRHVILYLSSAPKSEWIFNLSRVRKELPTIASFEHYPLWRTRAQMFAYIVHRSKAKDPVQRLKRSIQNLNDVQSILKMVGESDPNYLSGADRCSQCVLDDYAPPDNCKYLVTCQGVQILDEHIQVARKKAANFGLIKTLGDYSEQLNIGTGQKLYAAYQRYVLNILESGIGSVAVEKLQELRRAMMTTSDIRDAANLRSETQSEFVLRQGKDIITNVNQYLPTKPRIQSQEYADILSKILDYYKDPTQVQLFDEAYKHFLYIDSSTEEAINPEHELVRCYLYLAFSRGQGDEKAYNHARELLNKEAIIREQPRIEAEYLYLLTWAARRTERFKEADNFTTDAIKKWPDDPRFYHGRLLNTYTWLMNKKHVDCPHKLVDAINDAYKAVELYIRQSEQYEDLIAANYNNIAYFWAWEVTHSPYGAEVQEDRAREEYNVEDDRLKLTRARQALKELKIWAKKETWYPKHPEFFQTEAFVEYQEYLIGVASPGSIDIVSKLENANREINVAISIFPKPSYLELKTKIENARVRLRVESPVKSHSE